MMGTETSVQYWQIGAAAYRAEAVLGGGHGQCIQGSGRVSDHLLIRSGQCREWARAIRGGQIGCTWTRSGSTRGSFNDMDGSGSHR